MSTVGDVIDRVFRDWLYPVDDQPTRAVLASAITDSDTSLSYDDDFLIFEEELLLTPGQLIEVGSELMLVGAADAGTNTLTSLRRGMGGTTPTAHPADTLITINPLYSRKAAFDAIANTVSRLYPRLYQRKAVAVTSGSYAEIPGEARVIEGFWYLDNGRLTNVSVQAFDYPAADTERVLMFACEDDQDGFLVYRAPFLRPTAETDDLEADLGLRPEYEDLLVYSTASSLVASREFEALTSETLHRQLNTELVPLGSAIRVRRELKIMYEELLEELSTNLRSQNGTPIAVHGWT